MDAVGPFRGFHLHEEAEAGLERDLTMSLPDELLERIFWFLSHREIQAVGQVCRRWRRRPISMINHYGVFLGQQLSKFPQVSSAKSEQLSKISLEFPAAKRAIVEVLSDLEDEVLQQLSEASKDRAKSLSMLPKLGSIKKQITACNHVPDRYQEGNSQTLSEISKELAKMGEISWALKIANTMRLGEPKCEALCEIASQLAKIGEIDQALELAGSMRIENQRFKALIEIYGQVVKRGEIDRATTFANSLSAGSFQKEVFGKICQQLTARGKEESATVIANGVADTYDRTSVLSEIASQLAKMGEIDRALAFADTIPNESAQGKFWGKSDAFSVISKQLAKKGKIEDALELANRIPDTYPKNSALCEISIQLAKIGDIEGALVVGNTISCPEEKNKAVDGVFVELLRIGKVDRVLGLLDTVDGPREPFVFCEICSQLVKQERMEEATLVANKISGRRWQKALAHSLIFKGLAAMGKTEEAKAGIKVAIEVVRNIPLIEDRGHALYVISKALVEINKIEWAQGVANTIQTNEWGFKAWYEISKKLVEKRAYGVLEVVVGDEVFEVGADAVAPV